MAALHEQVEEEHSTCESRNTVVVTGFGPFKNHPVNASWEAVKLLPTTGIDKELGICLIIDQIPVAYEDVGKQIPALWKLHNPLLVIHVGVSHLTQKLTLETRARKYGYDKLDIYGHTPACDECCFGTSSKIYCELDLKEVKHKINSSSAPVRTTISHDAGRFLCEYSYYVSLSIDSSRALFVHVPNLDNPYSAEQCAQGLADIIRCLVYQLRHEKVDSANRWSSHKLQTS